MNIPVENSLIIKKHNRKIVERAFYKSEANFNYQFPKKDCQSNGEDSDIMSLMSGVSEVYDLNMQNYSKNFVQGKQYLITAQNNIKNLNKNKQACSSHLSPFNYPKRQFTNPSNNKQNKKLNFQSSAKEQPKKRYLSLTPQKQLKTLKLQQNSTHHSLNKFKNNSDSKQSNLKSLKINKQNNMQVHLKTISNVSTIESKHLEPENQQRNIKNIDQDKNFIQQIVVKLRKLSKKCFNDDQQEKEKIQMPQYKTQATFMNEQICFTKQNFKKKQIFQLNTAESSPNDLKSIKNPQKYHFINGSNSFKVSPFNIL